MGRQAETKHGNEYKTYPFEGSKACPAWMKAAIILSQVSRHSTISVMRALRKPPPSTLYFAGAFNSHIYFPDAAPQLLQRNLACSIVSRSDLTPCPEGSTVCVLVGSIPLSAAEAIPGLVGAFSLCRPSQQHRHKQQAVSQITAESVLGSESRQLVFFKNLEKGGTMQKQKGHMKGRSIKNDDADLPNKTKVWYRGIRFP